MRVASAETTNQLRASVSGNRRLSSLRKQSNSTCLARYLTTRPSVLEASMSFFSRLHRAWHLEFHVMLLRQFAKRPAAQPRDEACARISIFRNNRGITFYSSICKRNISNMFLTRIVHETLLLAMSHLAFADLSLREDTARRSLPPNSCQRFHLDFIAPGAALCGWGACMPFVGVCQGCSDCPMH